MQPGDSGSTAERDLRGEHFSCDAGELQYRKKTSFLIIWVPGSERMYRKVRKTIPPTEKQGWAPDLFPSYISY